MSRPGPLASPTLGRVLRARHDGETWMAEVEYPAAGEYPPHAHTRPYVSLVLRGGFEERLGRERREVGSAGVVVMPAGTEHAERFAAAGARSLVLVPGTMPAADGRRRLGAGIFLHGEVCRAAFAICRRWRRPDPGAALAIDERLAALLEAAAAHPAEGADGPLAERARDLLAGAPEGRLRLSEVAAELGCTPSHLARSFRRRFGCTMSRWIARRHARNAAGLLAGTSSPPAQVALECGFADQSHMTRVLRRELGVAPAELRRLVCA